MATAVRSNVTTIDEVRRALAQIVNESARWSTAYVKFAGATTGTYAPAGAYNIATITRAAAGTYDLVFENSMPNANYAVMATISSADAFVAVINEATTGFRVRTANSGGDVDPTSIKVVVHGPRA